MYVKYICNKPETLASVERKFLVAYFSILNYGGQYAY